MNEIKTYAVFSDEFPDDSEEAEGEIVKPTGRNVMDAICRNIALSGIPTSEPGQHSFYGWAAEFKLGKITIWFVLQTAGPQRLLIVESRASWLTGGKVRSDALRQGISTMDSALRADARIKDVRWMNKAEFEASQRRKPQF